MTNQDDNSTYRESFEVTAHAASWKLSVAFMEALGLAKLDTTTGLLMPMLDIQIDPCNQVDAMIIFDKMGNRIPGWFVNVRYYGQTAWNLQDGCDASSYDVFEYTKIIDLVYAYTGQRLIWTADAEDPIPPGYASVEGIRLYDPSLISTRARVWA